MRAILGYADKKDSAYILVLRGIDNESLRYVESHSKKYPTWGCLLFPEYRQVIKSPFKKNFSSIHGVYCDSDFSTMGDGDIRMWVKEKFPPYNEDDDVEIKIGFDPAMDIDLPKVDIPRPFIRSMHPLRTIVAKGNIGISDLYLDHSTTVENRVKMNVCRGIMDVLVKENLIHFEKVALPMGGFEIIGTIDVVPRE